MIHYFKTIDGKLTPLQMAEPGCWISVYEPSSADIRTLTDVFGLDHGFVRSCLDEEESSRVEREDGQTLIIVDTAVAEPQPQSDTMQYYTLPLGIINTSDYVFTISLRRNPVMIPVAEGTVSGLHTQLKTRFILQILMRISAGFVSYLKQIDKTSNHMERQLSGAMKNHEIVQLMALEKSLVYFTTSLKSNLITIEKIQRGRVVKLYEEDQDLMDDVAIEFRQAAEMANIYTKILSAMMDAFSYVIANNQNSVMWRLTFITVIIEIPNIIYGFYGMNTYDLPFPYTWFPLLISLLAMAIVAIVLWRQR